MSLSSPTSDGERFIMGGQLEVGISWSASLLSAFSFRIQECTITHGDTSVDVIKQGCFAGLLEAQPVETESNLSSAFAFNMFKALDEESATQVRPLLIFNYISLLENFFSFFPAKSKYAKIIVIKLLELATAPSTMSWPSPELKKPLLY